MRVWTGARGGCLFLAPGWLGACTPRPPRTRTRARARSARRFGGGISGYADVARTRGAPREADAPPIGTGLGATPRAAARPCRSSSRARRTRRSWTLQPEGLDVLRGVRGAVAPVVVIGPYRSGKSFLLNQLLGVACGAGFGVGHTRRTETKGVWVWSEPVPASARGAGNRRRLRRHGGLRGDGDERRVRRPHIRAQLHHGLRAGV